MPSSGPSDKRILVVDDSRFVRTTFRGILGAAFAVLEEADGEAAWRVVSSDPSVVMVFTDLDMPKLDGFGLLGRIRASADARIRELPVVIITGDEQPATRARARDAGANDFISKSADAPEVLARIDNLLRLVKANQTATHDALTGALTLHALVSEGRKYFAQARRHGTDLSVMALRLDSIAELARQAGREAADQLLAQVAKVMLGTLRAGDSLGRAAAATFVLLAPGTPAPQMRAVGERLKAQLQGAQVGFRGQALKIACSWGVASAGLDRSGSVEDLIRLALQRFEAPPPAPAPRAALGEDLERALRVLEAASRQPLGARAPELMRRLLAIAKMLKAEQK